MPGIRIFTLGNEKMTNPPVINNAFFGEIFLTKCDGTTIGNKLYLILVKT